MFRSNQPISLLNIIPKFLVLQIACLLISCGLWLDKAQGSTDNHWIAQYPSCLSSYLTDIWATSMDNAFAVGYNLNGPVIGHYDGNSWENMDSSLIGTQIGELNAIWGSTENNIWAVGGIINDGAARNSLILYYNGSTWSQNEGIFPSSLFDIWGSGPDDIFAVGEAGFIIHWDGSLWSLMDSGVESDLYGVWGDGQGMVFAVGPDTILIYQDGIWRQMTNIPSCYLSGIRGTPGGDIWAVGDCILRYRQGVWRDITPHDFPLNFWLSKIDGDLENNIIAVGAADEFGETGFIVRYDGTAWRKEDGNFPGYLNGVWLGAENKAMIAGGNFLYDLTTKGIILSSQGIGSSWSITSSESYEGTFYQLWANSSQDVFAVGGHPDPLSYELAKSFVAHYDGQTWTPIYLDEFGMLFGIWGSPQGELFAVGADKYISLGDEVITESQIYYSPDGTQWESMENDFEDILQGVWGTSGGNVFAVGYNIYHFDGNTWSVITSPISANLCGIWGHDANHIFIVGEPSFEEGENGKATILYYDGRTWSSMPHNIYGYLFKVWGTSPANVFAVGESGIVHYDGQVWSIMDCPVEGHFYDIWGTSPTDIFAVGEYGIVHYNGQVWTNTGYIVDPYTPLFTIGGTSGGEVFAAGDYGTVLQYENGEFSEQKIFLREGWNLISYQVNLCIYDRELPPDLSFPEGIEFSQVESLASFLSDEIHSPIRDALDSSKAGDWQRITSFSKDGARLLDKALPSFVNDLHYLSPGCGYWIKMNAPAYLVLTGQAIPPSTSIVLHEGWNLIGPISADRCYYDTTEVPSCIASEVPRVTFVPVSSQSVKTVLASIEGKYSRVTGFDCSGVKLYDSKIPAWVSNLHYIAPGSGYWIKMTGEAALSFPQ